MRRVTRAWRLPLWGNVLDPADFPEPVNVSNPRSFLCAVAVALLGVSSVCEAVEVQFEGAYRARARLYDSLSIDRTLAESEDAAMFFQHRLWLRPKFLVTDEVGLFVDIRGFDGVYWGEDPYAHLDYESGEEIPAVFSDELTAPVSSDDERVPLLDFTLWRAWGEVHTPIGEFRFGRMPVHWGLGIWQNDGLGFNADYGDTVDRLMWQHEISKVFVRVALDVNAEGFVNQQDDTTSFSAALAYRHELFEVGLQGHYRRTPSLELELFTVDLEGAAELGPISVQLEVAGQFGGGNLENGLNDVNFTAVGGVLDAKLELKPVTLELMGGFATGDGEIDSNFRTFAFDRDFNLGVIMFEQPMPTFAAAVPNEANAGRDFETAMMGDRVQNALFLRPRITARAPWRVLRGLEAQVSMVAARAAKLPEADAERYGYGMEFDVGLNYVGISHFEFSATFGAFLPGERFRNYSDDFYTDGFSDPVFGGQMITRLRF